MGQLPDRSASCAAAVGSRASTACGRPPATQTSRIIPATISASGSCANANSRLPKQKGGRRGDRLWEIESRVKSRLGRIEAELRPAALGVGLGFPAALLVRGLERTEPAHFFQNSFGVQLVFQALQGPVYRFTFTNNHFRHVSSSFLKNVRFRTGAAEPTRAAGGRQLL